MTVSSNAAQMAEIIAIDQNPEQALARALASLKAAELVAIPTETVYGLAADATNSRAVQRIYEAKGRPSYNPLICHVSDLAMAQRHAHFDPLSRQLATAFWPGPLTLVLPLRAESTIASQALAGLDTIAMRAPRGFAGRLIDAFGRPLAAPSANRSGRISPTCAAHVEADLGQRIGLIVDGGACTIGLESTILRVEDGTIRLLRPGGLSLGEIEAASGRKVVVKSAESKIGTMPQAPGMLASHYAPRAALRLEAREVHPGEALIRFGGVAIPGEDKAATVLDLSPSGDLAEAARNLFSALHAADASGVATIAIAPIPRHGLGQAMADRLARAAAPR